MNDEASYTCDSCGEEIVVPVDLSAGSSQEYVEDCPVCCLPISSTSKSTRTATCGFGRSRSRITTDGRRGRCGGCGRPQLTFTTEGSSASSIKQLAGTSTVATRTLW